MRRRSFLLSTILTGALALAAGAAASNGGISPVDPVSPNAHRITDAYWLVLAVVGAVLILVETALVISLIRHRRRGRPRYQDGPQLHGATRIEALWTIGPVVLLAVIAGIVFYKLPGITNAPAASNTITIKVEGYQFYWLFTYPDGSQSINRLVVPVDTPVRLNVTSVDVVHSWWVPAFGGKIDAIPGTTNHTWFQAERTGTFPIRCAEFCGIQHAVMQGAVTVTRGTNYGSPVELGEQAYAGVCASCHGYDGEGLVGPAIATNPTLGDKELLSALIRNGQGRMPGVGKTWSDDLMDATTEYLQKRFAGGGTAGG